MQLGIRSLIQPRTHPLKCLRGESGRERKRAPRAEETGVVGVVGIVEPSREKKSGSEGEVRGETERTAEKSTQT